MPVGSSGRHSYLLSFLSISKNAIAQELKGDIVLKPRIENAW